MNNQGYETKEIENQPRLKNFNLNMILTCNMDIKIEAKKRLGFVAVFSL